MKKIWLTMFIVFTAFVLILIMTGCSGHKAVVTQDVATQPAGDILYEILNNKDHPDGLRRILNGLLKNGEVNDRDHTSVRFADGSVLTREKWFLKDEGDFLHAVFFEQGILIKIDQVKDKAEWEKIEPFGGWRIE